MLIKIIFFLFIAVPLLELYVLIEVGSGIGGIATIALCLFTAALGGLLIRIQGIKTLLSAQQQMTQGALPAEHALHGIFLAIAGLLLFLPGFITDTLGFLLLIPAIRVLLMKRAISFSPNPSKTVILEAEIIDEQEKIRH
ncbi:MAG: FxsA family protein [Mariprofundaceae bacterium]|nr:FxsA family protein [Mariprofundaceae bacterium]